MKDHLLCFKLVPEAKGTKKMKEVSYKMKNL